MLYYTIQKAQVNTSKAIMALLLINHLLVYDELVR